MTCKIDSHCKWNEHISSQNEIETFIPMPESSCQEFSFLKVFFFLLTATTLSSLIWPEYRNATALQNSDEFRTLCCWQKNFIHCEIARALVCVCTLSTSAIAHLFWSFYVPINFSLNKHNSSTHTPHGHRHTHEKLELQTSSCTI